MPERYSLKTPSNWFQLFHQIEQARLRLSGTTAIWQVPIELNENVCCSLHVWRTPFSVVPIHRTVHHKNESWTDGNSLSRKIQMCSCVLSVHKSVVTFHWCSVYGPRQANLVLIAYASSEGSGEPAHPRSLARTFAARSYKQWVKRNLQRESQIAGSSEWLGMRS